MVCALVALAGTIIAPATGAPQHVGCSPAESKSYAVQVKRAYHPQRWHTEPRRARAIANSVECRGQRIVHARAVQRWRKARRTYTCGTPACNLRIGMYEARGYSRTQRRCFAELGFRESGWNERAINPSSGAGGIAQGLPPSKMGAAASPSREAADWLVARAQVRWMLHDYIRGRYGTPCAALAFHNGAGWY
jgi:hypothetical protein